jgi:hypothetical protein
LKLERKEAFSDKVLANRDTRKEKFLHLQKQFEITFFWSVE